MKYQCTNCEKVFDSEQIIDIGGGEYYCTRCYYEEEKEEAVPLEIQNGKSALNPKGF